MRGILVTGLCTLHWGRLQYGNIGNYYIIEPLFRELHHWFEDYVIYTTFQMDDDFVKREHIEIIPMENYYSWGAQNIDIAREEVCMAERYMRGEASLLSSYMKVLLECEYVINVSGDMWGDNAEHVGEKRFLNDCLKMKTAQILNKKTILYAVTPGPFSDSNEAKIAREVFEKFNLVVIREEVSRENLIKWGFPVKNVIWAPCPSFLFDKNEEYSSVWTNAIESVHRADRKVVGLTFGGFNMPEGPYDMWPRSEEQYKVYVSLVKFILDNYDTDILLFSHTNGFDTQPCFRLKNGRDFLILQRFYEILTKDKDVSNDRIILVDEPLLPCNMKALIGKLDMLVTGRVHASVAATSQCIPTVFIEYDERVIYSDKMTGFSKQLGLETFVCNPKNLQEMKEKVECCYVHRRQVEKHLQSVIPDIKEKAINVYGLMKRS